MIDGPNGPDALRCKAASNCSFVSTKARLFVLTIKNKWLEFKQSGGESEVLILIESVRKTPYIRGHFSWRLAP